MAIETPGCCDTQYDLLRKILLGLNEIQATDGNPIEVQDEGATLTLSLETINFVGDGVTATVSGNDVTVTIPSGGAPSGPAGGTLGGTYPNPTIATGGSGNFTPGSVIFAGATGGLDEDNANLFFDNADDILTVNEARFLTPLPDVLFIGRMAGNTTLTGTPNTGIGANSLAALTTGTNNVAHGVNNLATNTTGSSNTAVGSNALDSNISGSQNTAFGREALGSNTTVSDLTAIGFNALLLNTSGAHLVAVGSGALRANDSGNANTAIGKDALILSATASNNTAVGHNALSSTISGGNNTAVGRQALLSTTGSSNTAVGADALDAATTGGSNVAVGANSLGSVTNSSSNVGVGRDALGATTTGGTNVGIGQNAGDTNTTGTLNTFLGHNSDTTGTGLTNSMALGANAIFTASNSVIIGDSATFVGIAGVGAATSKLQVSGAIATPVRTEAAAYPVVATDSVILVNAVAAPVTITLPTPVGITGRHYTVKKIDASANAVTIATAAGTIDGAATKVTIIQFTSFDFVSDGANWFIV